MTSRQPWRNRSKGSGLVLVLTLAVGLVVGLTLGFIAGQAVSRDAPPTSAGELVSRPAPPGRDPEGSDRSSLDVTREVVAAEPARPTNAASATPTPTAPEGAGRLRPDEPLALDQPTIDTDRIRALMRGDREERLAVAHEILAEGATGGMAHRAMAVLVELDPHTALAKLRELGESGDPRTLRLDGTMLRRLDRHEGVVADADLVAFFEDDSFDLRATAARILEERGDPSLVDRLLEEQMEAASSDDASARAEAARRFAQLDGPEVAEALSTLLRDESEEVRLTALQSMAQSPAPSTGGPDTGVPSADVMESLRPLLEDESERVRRTAARILEGMERRAQMQALRREAEAAARRR